MSCRGKNKKHTNIKQSRTKQVFFIAKYTKFVTFLLMLWSWLLKARYKLTRDSNKLVFKLCKSMQQGILLFILKQMLIQANEKSFFTQQTICSVDGNLHICLFPHQQDGLLHKRFLKFLPRFFAIRHLNKIKQKFIP